MSTTVPAPRDSEPQQGDDFYWRHLLLGLFYIVLPVLLIYLVFKVLPPFPWPVDNPDAPPEAQILTATTQISFLRGTVSLWTTLEERLILLVIVAGALGSYVHAATSFADYLGNRKFANSWTWWYILRPFIGIVLALVIYFAIRGGFILLVTREAAEAKDINPFGIGALAALTGMFSKQATDKLNEVFTTLFKPSPGEGDEKRRDGLNEPALAITDVTPKEGPTAGGMKVTVTGTGFSNKPQVFFGEAEAASVVLVGSTSLTAVTPPHDAATVDVKVKITETREAILNDGFTFIDKAEDDGVEGNGAGAEGGGDTTEDAGAQPQPANDTSGSAEG